jgi:low temperature requirement protein LtrA
VWWAWIDTAWITNWLDPERTAVRLLLFALMLAGLVLSASIPKAFENRGMAFAVSFAAIQIGRSLFMLWATRNHDAGNFKNFVRIVTWQAVAAVLWLAGAWSEGAVRLTLWTVAVGIETVAPMVGFWVPVLGRSITTDWVV